MAATLAAVLCLLLGEVAESVGGETPPNSPPPLVGRPADLPFSGASAGFAADADGEYRSPFAVQVSVSAADVEELAPVTFTVDVTAVAAAVYYPPTRINLREVSAFSRRFYIEDLTDGKKEHHSPSSWRWVYRLRPREAGIDEVPGLPFVFYNPDVKPAEKGFQVLWTDPVPLRVRPAERQAPPVEAPKVALAVVTGPRVLRAQPIRAGRDSARVLLTLAAPPAGCLAWYVLWRRRHPDAGRQLRERRSRSAQQALQLLDAAVRQRGRRRAEEVAAALAAYLRERFEFPGREPTPAEVFAWLRVRGIAAGPAEQAQRLLAVCAEGRFQPDHDLGIDLPRLARDWIISMEELSCPPS